MNDEWRHTKLRPRKTPSPVIPFLACLPLLAGCGAAMRAAPVTDARPPAMEKTRAGYPSALYLTGLGISTAGWDQADARARLELIKTIEVKINGKDTFVTALETKKEGEKNYTVRYHRAGSRVAAEAEASVRGLVIAGQWREGDIFYSLAVLDRREAGARLRDEIRQKEASIAYLAAEAEGLEAGRDYAGALKGYLRARGKQEALRKIMRKYEVIRIKGEQDGPDSGGITAETLDSRIGALVSSLGLLRVSGNGQRGRMGLPLKEKLVARAVFRRNGEKIPVSGMPVVFRFGKERLKGEKVTREGGLAACPVLKLTATGEAVNYISCKFDVAELEKETGTRGLLKDLEAREVSFQYTLPDVLESAPAATMGMEQGIRDLVRQIISVPEGVNLKVAVLDFRETGRGARWLFSRILEDDLKTELKKVANLKMDVMGMEVEGDEPVEEKAGLMGAEQMLTGGYRVEKGALKLNARLVELKTGKLLSTGRVSIALEGLSPEWLKPGRADGPGDRLSLDLGIFYEGKEGRLYPMREGMILDSDDNYALHITPNEQCWLYIYQVDSTGRAFRLFPSDRYRTAGNPIKKGGNYWVPNGEEYFYLDNTTGRETFYVFASDKAVPALERIERTMRKELSGFIRKMGPAGTRRGSFVRTVTTPKGEDMRVLSRKLGSSGGFVYRLTFWHR